MFWPELEEGKTYRLQRELEIHDDKTGTPRALLRKGTLVKVRKLDSEDDHAFIEGLAVPLPLNALRRIVSPVAS